MERGLDEAVNEISLVVTAADTALAHHSGDVPVLATPRVLALAEEAACQAVAARLDEGKTTVGIEAEIHHVKATRVGAVVTARAELVATEDRKMTFEFTVTEGDETVAFGTHRRVVVDRARFLG